MIANYVIKLLVNIPWSTTKVPNPAPIPSISLLKLSFVLLVMKVNGRYVDPIAPEINARFFQEKIIAK